MSELAEIVAAIWSQPLPAGATISPAVPGSLVRLMDRADADERFLPDPRDTERALRDLTAAMTEAGGHSAEFIALYGRTMAKSLADLFLYRRHRDLSTPHLGRDGFLAFQVPEAHLQAITALYGDRIAAETEAARTGANKRPTLPLDVGTDPFRALEAWYEEAGILDEIRAYRGLPVTMAGAYIVFTSPKTDWWVNAARQPLQWTHYDRHFTLLKSAIYLNEVGHAGQGPFRYIRGSNRLSPPCLKAVASKATAEVGPSDFAHLPEPLRHRCDNFAVSADVFPALLRHEQVFYGPRGTGLAFDGANGLHRGGFTTEGERIMLFVNFEVVAG